MPAAGYNLCLLLYFLEKRRHIDGLLVPDRLVDFQRRFAAIVESAEQQKTRLRAHLAELDTLFAALQHRAFNGALDA